MYRRRFLAAIGTTVLTVVAGCTSDETETPPPRKSSVVEQIETKNGSIRISLVDDAWVLSRITASSSGNAQIAPVGVVAGKSGGSGSARGATGRAGGGHGSASRTIHGWAWWHGGDYTDDWYEDHEDETTEYPVQIKAIGVRHFGSDAKFQKNRPSAGPVDWDWTYRFPENRIDHPLRNPGWYRVGAHIVGKKVDHDFNWECIDFEVSSVGQSYTVENEWKVSPRI